MPRLASTRRRLAGNFWVMRVLRPISKRDNRKISPLQRLEVDFSFVIVAIHAALGSQISACIVV
jgi:hypothetical protein